MNLSISNSFFNEKFKDYIRNFYVYGCVPDSDFPGSIRTYRDDFSRIESIGYIPLSDGEHDRDYRWRMEGTSKCLRLITSESRELNRNPVHIFYRLHESRETEALFFLTAMLLAACCRQSGEDMKIDQIMAWTDPQWRQEWEALCRSAADGEKKTARGPRDLKEEERRRKEANKSKKAFRDKTQASVRKRMLQEFGSTGILDYRTVGNNNIWSLPELTLDALLGSVSDEECQDLLTAVDFFMKLGPFGEIGDMLLSRLEPNMRKAVQSGSIRLNQFYLYKSLNDYNSADILQAIHSGSWIIVTYHDQQRDVRGNVLCVPLKLRSSVTNGREYLGYYDPVRRQVCYLRLEFVQSVEILDRRYTPWLWAALRGTPCAVLDRRTQRWETVMPEVLHTDGSGSVRLARYTGSGSRIQAELGHREDGGAQKFIPAKDIEDCRLPDPEVLEAELGKARSLLDRAWGASVPYQPGAGTIDDIKVHVLTMTVYVWAGEDHIRRRLTREARYGFCRDLDEHQIRFETEVLDPWEMIPWLSSFAGRIKSITCTDHGFEEYFRGHLRKMRDPAADGGPAGTMPRPVAYHIPNLLRDTKTQTYKGNLRSASPLCRKEPSHHEVLFSSLYSDVYRNCFAAFDKLCAGDSSGVRRFWNEKSRAAEDVIVLDQKAVDELASLPKQGSAARFEQILPRVRSICRLAAKLRDVTPVMLKLVPLTILERKWLLAIMQDPLIGYFLRPDTVDVLSTVLKTAGTGRPLYLPGEIDFFDRYRNHSHSQAHTKANFRLMRQAVKSGCSLHITYRTHNSSAAKEMDVLAVRMEYAARDDAFRIWVRDLDDGSGKTRVRTLRLEQIEDVQVRHGTFRKALRAQPSRQEYVLRFSGARNLPDRLLTHFAPWEKQCVKFSDDDYQLRFWADESEWRDIMIRIMSFGHLVRVEQPAKVAQEIRFRLKRQENMWM